MALRFGPVLRDHFMMTQIGTNFPGDHSKQGLEYIPEQYQKSDFTPRLEGKYYAQYFQELRNKYLFQFKL